MLKKFNVGDYVYCGENAAWKVISAGEGCFPFFIIENTDNKILKNITDCNCSCFKPVPRDENGDWLFIGDKVLYDNHGDIIELTIKKYDTWNPAKIYATDNVLRHDNNYFACTLTRKDSYSYENIYKDVDEILTRIENDTKKLKELLKCR